MQIVCRKCSFRSRNFRNIVCPDCGDILEVEEFKLEPIGYDLRSYVLGKLELLNSFKGKFSIGEGWTPLIESTLMENVYFKDEGRNPTGSFRDRAASLVIPDAVHSNYTKTILASDGNMAVSVACYASRARLKTNVYAPYWVDEEKISLANAFGAKVFIKDESLDRLLKYVEKRAKRESLYDASSTHNVFSLEGMKTLAYEIAVQSSLDEIDKIYVPLGSGLTYLALYLGLKELSEKGLIPKMPRLIGVESCSNPIYSSHLKNVRRCKESPLPGLYYRRPPFMEKVIDVIKRAGETETVTYRETINAVKTLLRSEGIFTEPSSAVGLASLLSSETEKSIVILTSHGFKSWSALAKPSKRRSLELFPSVTKSHILKLIEKNPGISGYEIWKRIGIEISIQAIYQHLWDLEARSLIYSKKEGKKRKYYRKKILN